jgi:hypothetical protein
MLRDYASRNCILLCGAASSNEIFPALIPTEFSKPFLIPIQRAQLKGMEWNWQESRNTANFEMDERRTDA